MPMFMIVGGLPKDFEGGLFDEGGWIIYSDGRHARDAVEAALDDIYDDRTKVEEQLIIVTALSGKARHIEFIWKAPTEGFLDVRA